MSTPGHNRLAELAAQISEAHRAAELAAQSSAEHAIAAGQNLLEAKAAVPRGGWGPWLKANCPFSERKAQMYMSFAKAGLKSATVAEMGIRGAAKSLSRPRATTEAAAASAFGLMHAMYAAREKSEQLPTVDNLRRTIEAAGDLWATIDQSAPDVIEVFTTPTNT